MASYLELFCGVITLLIVFYYYWVSHYDFWKKRGVFGPRPHPLFGNLLKLTFVRIGIVDVVLDLYEKYKHEPVVGLYEGISPILVIHDVELIKKVLIKDFSSFQERPHTVHERTEPMSLNLFQLDAARWAMIRPKISPFFTSKKLREMYTLIVECSKCLEEYLDNVIGTGESVNIRELTSKYTIDVIGSCAFGINVNTINGDNHEFCRIGKHIFAGSLEHTFRLKTRLFSQKLYNLLGFVMPEKTVTRFFTNLVTNMMKSRQEQGIYRPDFINMLIEFKKHPEQMKGIELTDTFLTAQAVTFFAAGFETSSTTMTWALYELAQNHEIQDKLHEEIKAYHNKYGDAYTVDSTNEMQYLDKVIKETLRKHPVGAIYQRRTTQEYTFDTLKFSLPKMVDIWIPTIALHRDPEIYPDPMKFDPERFNKEQVAARHPMYYLPFSDGPRNCIGARFAAMTVRLGLIKMLRNHKVDICEKTRIPHEYDIGSFSLQPKGNLYLKMTKLK